VSDAAPASEPQADDAWPAAPSGGAARTRVDEAVPLEEAAAAGTTERIDADVATPPGGAHPPGEGVSDADGPEPADNSPPTPPTPPTPTPPPASTAVRPLPRGGGVRKPGAPRKRVKPLQSVFNEMRARARDTDEAAAAHERFDLAQYHLRDGNEVAAMTELQEAARAPVLRFAASAQLGRLLAARNELAPAVEWLERAAGVPPVTPDEGLAVLYELADTLERVGEPERALAVFIELQSQRRAYRDVAARIAALSAPGAGDPQA
jgi:tetratricopeptide (TPR) repeat protein